MEGICFLDYLSSQPADRLDALYRSRWTCAALLRALPPLARYTVLRLLHVEAPLSVGALVALPGGCAAHTHPPASLAPPDALRLWARPQVLEEHEEALEVLCQLRVLVAASAAGQGQATSATAPLVLHPAVRQHLSEGLYDQQPETPPALPEELQARAGAAGTLSALPPDTVPSLS